MHQTPVVRLYVTGLPPAALLALKQVVPPNALGIYLPGFKLLTSNDGHTYQVYLKGIPPAMTFNVSQSVYTSSAGTSPPGDSNLLVRSVDDRQFYNVFLTTVGIVTTINVNQTPIAPDPNNSL